MVVINNIELDQTKNSSPQNASLKALIDDICCGDSISKSASAAEESIMLIARQVIASGIR